MRGVSNFGDMKIKEKGVFEKKSKAGLSREDFLKYWNRPWVWIAVEEELANLIRFSLHLPPQMPPQTKNGLLN